MAIMVTGIAIDMVIMELGLTIADLFITMDILTLDTTAVDITTTGNMLM